MTESNDSEKSQTFAFTAAIKGADGEGPCRVQVDGQGITIHGSLCHDVSTEGASRAITFGWQDVHCVSAFTKSLDPYITIICAGWAGSLKFSDWPTRDEVFDTLQERFPDRTDYEFIQTPLWKKVAVSSTLAVLILFFGVRWSLRYGDPDARPRGMLNSLAHEMGGSVGIFVLWFSVFLLFVALTLLIVTKHRGRAKKTESRN